MKIWSDREHGLVSVPDDRELRECGCYYENGELIDPCDEHLNSDD